MVHFTSSWMGASNFRRKLRHNSRGRKTLVGVRWHSSFQIPQRQRDAGNKNQDRQREKYAPPLLSGFLLVFFLLLKYPFCWWKCMGIAHEWWNNLCICSILLQLGLSENRVRFQWLCIVFPSFVNEHILEATFHHVQTNARWHTKETYWVVYN